MFPIPLFPKTLENTAIYLLCSSIFPCANAAGQLKHIYKKIFKNIVFYSVFTMFFVKNTVIYTFFGITSVQNTGFCSVFKALASKNPSKSRYLQCFFILVRFSITGSLPKWPKIQAQTPKNRRKISETPPDSGLGVKPFLPPPAKADIATAILTNVIEHLDAFSVAVCTPISTPSPPKRCGRILNFSLSLSLSALWLAFASNFCAFSLTAHPKGSRKWLLDQSGYSRLSNGCQICWQKDIYQSNAQTMLIYASFSTFRGVVVHAQKRSFTPKNSLSRSNHAPIALPFFGKTYFLGFNMVVYGQKRVSWLDSNDLSILTLFDFML